MSILGIIAILAIIFLIGWIILELLTAPCYTEPYEKLATIAESCGEVLVSEIEPPHNSFLTAAELKRRYLDAERAMVETHDPSMAQSIRRRMAGCLIQGWPVDVAVCQAAYSFMAGTCRCPTCQHLINSHQ